MKPTISIRIVLASLLLATAAQAIEGLQVKRDTRLRNKLTLRFPKSGPNFENSQLLCSPNLVDWIPYPDGPTIDGNEYAVDAFAGDGRQEFFRFEKRPPFAFDPPGTPGESEFMFQSEDGKMRRILIYVPERYPNNPPLPPEDTGPSFCEPGWPLLFAFSGGGQSARSFATANPGLIDKCNREGVILVIPQSTRHYAPPNNYSWNSREDIQRRDDVLFVISILQRIKARLEIDDERVYLTGFSGGGSHGQVMAIRTPRVFAAAGFSGSSLVSNDQTDPLDNPEHPAPGLPILFVNGKIDLAHPYHGGLSCASARPVNGICPGPSIFGSVFQTVAYWQGINRCQNGFIPVTTTLPDFPGGHPFLSWPGLTNTDFPQQVRDELNTDLPSIGKVETWCPQVYPCSERFEVTLASINALSHTYSDPNTGYDTDEELVDFLLSHRKVPMKDTGDFSSVARTAGGTRGVLPGVEGSVIFKIPGDAKALVLVSHGFDQDATFVDCVEITDILATLETAGLGWVAWNSQHQGPAPAARWDIVNDLSANPDLVRAIQVRDALIASGQIAAETPIHTLGFDQGAIFALLLAHTFENRGDPILSFAQLCPDFDDALPGASAAAAAAAAADTRLPMHLFVAECDPIANKLAAFRFYQEVRYRSELQHQLSRMCVGVEKCPAPARFNRIVPAVNGNDIMRSLVDQGIVAVDQGRWRRNFCKQQLAVVLENMAFPAGLGLTGEQRKEVRHQVEVIFAAHHPDARCAPDLADFICSVPAPIIPDDVNSPVPTQPGTYDLTFYHAGRPRTFRMQVPAGYDGTGNTPLVLVFHGGGQFAKQFSNLHPRLFEKCDEEQMILVVPQATTHPEAGKPLWGSQPDRLPFDDRDFVKNLIAHLDAELAIDDDRIYAAGFSNGAEFTHFMAATRPGILAAIAPVCGAIGWHDAETQELIAPPEPLEPVSVLMINGVLDLQRPIDGGINANGVEVFSASDGLDYWSAAAGCIGSAVTTTDGTGTVTTHTYDQCDAGSEVILTQLDLLDHQWPDADDGVNYDANEAVIDFFGRHSR